MSDHTPGPWEAVPFNFSCVNMWDIRVKNRPDDDPYPIADMVFLKSPTSNFHINILKLAVSDAKISLKVA